MISARNDSTRTDLPLNAADNLFASTYGAYSELSGRFKVCNGYFFFFHSFMFIDKLLNLSLKFQTFF